MATPNIPTERVLSDADDENEVQILGETQAPVDATSDDVQIIEMEPAEELSHEPLKKCKFFFGHTKWFPHYFSYKKKF